MKQASQQPNKIVLEAAMQVFCMVYQLMRSAMGQGSMPHRN